MKRVEVVSFISEGFDQKKMREAKNYYGLSFSKIMKVPFYLVKNESEEEVSEEILRQVFEDEVVDKIEFSNWALADTADVIVEVSFRPGVTDNKGRSAEDAFLLFDERTKVFSGVAYHFFGEFKKEELLEYANENLGNPLIEDIQIFSADEYERRNRFEVFKAPEVQMLHGVDNNGPSFDCSMDELLSYSEEHCLALNEDELLTIKNYFSNEEILKKREKRGLSSWPTKLELEVLAQTWSEHCKHKIFSANISYKESIDSQSYQALGDKKINSLYRSYIKNATKEVEEERELDWAISVFSDNAGIVRFDSNIDLCIKVETHNSPSALDPYGGALTGILGVNRDIIGTGLGAKPIANTDVFCFADPEWPLPGMDRLMPSGLMEPRRLLEGVHKGVEDGGNKSGIPTVNGAFVFDESYAGKPLVFCGTIGSMPQSLKDGRNTFEKAPSAGDYVVIVGGEVGADGIHGATFSSLELNESSPVTAVQIGDPMTQKRVLDFILEARDECLYSCITDNGAGGISSSVGEMASLCNGASIHLDQHPIKYDGLSPWEIMISESQERMTLAVPQENWADFLELSRSRGVKASILGEFNNSGNLTVFYKEELMGELCLDFLHNGLAPMELNAYWDGPRRRESWMKGLPSKDVINSKKFSSVLHKLLHFHNIASKKDWVQQYDHEVQGATHIKPFMGKEQKTPSDSGVIMLEGHGGERDNAVSIGCGIQPRMSLIDPYLMGIYSVDEAVRNVIASGGDIDELCLLDNFCWPDPVQTKKNPEGDYKLGQLVRTCEGLYDACKIYGAPLVSGKDSMKNDFRGKNKEGAPLSISILPTLLVTAMAKTNAQFTKTPELKKEGDLIYLIGGTQSSSLMGSSLLELYDYNEEEIPKVDLELNKKIYRQIFKSHQKKLFTSVHDVSDGGWMISLVEGLFEEELGASINLVAMKENELIRDLFHEGIGRFIVSIDKEKKEEFESSFNDLPCREVGVVTRDNKVTLKSGERILLDENTQELYRSWNRDWSAKEELR